MPPLPLPSYSGSNVLPPYFEKHSFVQLHPWFHVWCLLTWILSKFSLASFSYLSETVWEYCVLVLTVLPLSICLTHGFYLERHSSNCVTTNILQNFIRITIYNRIAMKIGQYEIPFKIGIASLWEMMERAFFSWIPIVLWWSVYVSGKGKAQNKLAYLILPFLQYFESFILV